MSFRQSKEADQRRVRIRCPNPNCDYSWMYSGRLLYYATCPSCRRNVKIQVNKVESPQSIQVGHPSQIAAVRNTPAGADA
jgi:hypothetical protein